VIIRREATSVRRSWNRQSRRRAAKRARYQRQRPSTTAASSGRRPSQYPSQSSGLWLGGVLSAFPQLAPLYQPPSCLSSPIFR